MSKNENTARRMYQYEVAPTFKVGDMKQIGKSCVFSVATCSIRVDRSFRDKSECAVVHTRVAPLKLGGRMNYAAQRFRKSTGLTPPSVNHTSSSSSSFKRVS